MHLPRLVDEEELVEITGGMCDPDFPDPFPPEVKPRPDVPSPPPHCFPEPGWYCER